MKDEGRSRSHPLSYLRSHDIADTHHKNTLKIGPLGVNPYLNDDEVQIQYATT